MSEKLNEKWYGTEFQVQPISASLQEVIAIEDCSYWLWLDEASTHIIL